MVYGLDNYFLDPPFSLIFSIFLFFGLANLGFFILKFSIVKKIFSNCNYIYLNSPLVGFYLVMILFYPLLLFEKIEFQYLHYFSIFLIISGFLFLFFLFYLILKNYNNLKNFFPLLANINFIIIFLIIFGLFFISASPITHVDSLAYHVLSAIKILHYGELSKDIISTTQRLAGIGELILSIGFAFKAEHFGSLIQFSAILSLISLFFESKNKNTIYLNNLILLLILSTPVLIFLVSSPKPQIIPIISSLIIFLFIIRGFEKHDNKTIILLSLIIILILAINIQIKYSIIIGSSILWLLIFFKMLQKKLLIKYLSVSLFVFFVIFVPLYYWRYINFGTTLIDSLLSPLPINIYGYDAFNDYLQKGIERWAPFPIWLLIPQILTPFSTYIGPSLLIIFFIKKKNLLEYKYYFLAVLSLFLLLLTLVQPSSRFFFEPFLWLMALVYLSGIYPSNLIKNFYRVIILHSIIIISAVYFMVFQLFPGSLSLSQRENVMTNNANGYSLIKWVNEELPENSVVLSTHKSIALLNFPSITNHYIHYIDLDNVNSKPYIDFIQSINVNKIFFRGQKLNTSPYTKCLGKQIAYKKNVGRFEGRNPFNKGEFYNGWIFEFNSDKFPNCK